MKKFFANLCSSSKVAPEKSRFSHLGGEPSDADRKALLRAIELRGNMLPIRREARNIIDGKNELEKLDMPSEIINIIKAYYLPPAPSIARAMAEKISIKETGRNL
ncbi:MAG TPA: hypothetical protein V6C58_23635 [Allocoleopsis sp.]